MTASPVQPVLRSKVLPTPIPAGLLVRQRLLDRLAGDARVQLVAAMPGFGKTVLVRHWVDSIEVPVAWVSLDLLDEDPSTFWTHLVFAVQSAVPGVDDEPAKLLAERGVDDPVFLAALIAELESSDHRALLVLDGLPSHLDRGIADGLALLVGRVGHLLRLVVTTRSNPALPLGRWRTLGWLNEVREDELALADVEAAAVARMLDAAADESPDEAVALNRRVAGWPLGLHMALLARRPAEADGSSAGLPTPPALVVPSYLVADVLDALSERERWVAMSLSVLEWFDHDVCAAILGDDVGVVNDLMHRGLFLTVVDGRPGAMTFHSLFRELMELELGARDPHRRVELHRHASMIWRDRGDLMAAYRHLSAIGETDKAHELIVGPALELVDSGDLRALHRFARQLPTARDIDDADLAVDLAWIALYSDGTVAARRWTDHATSLIEASVVTAEPSSPRSDTLVGRLRELRCAVASFDADLDAALSGLSEHPQPVDDAGSGLFEQRFPIIAARTMLAARDLDVAESWIRAGERIDGADIVSAVTVPTLRGWHEWLVGDLQSAVSRLEAALTWMDDHHIGPHHHAFDTLISAAWCRMSAGRLADAWRLADRAHDDAEVLGAAWCRLQSGYLSARLALASGDPLRALRTCDDLRSQIDFEACWPYAQRILGVEIEALGAVGRLDDVRRMVDMLDAGPRRQLLMARFVCERSADAEELLAERRTWSALERLQAELIVAASTPRADPHELLTLIAECVNTGWVLPLLELRPMIEASIPASRLAQLHPQLGPGRASADAAVRTDPARAVRLTDRELTLVRLLPTHLTYAAMGAQLFLSVNTVKLHLKSVYRKLGASTRDEAVAAARQAGLL